MNSVFQISKDYIDYSKFIFMDYNLKIQSIFYKFNIATNEKSFEVNYFN